MVAAKEERTGEKEHQSCFHELHYAPQSPSKVTQGSNLYGLLLK
jgi:hypothetical protein